MPDIRANLSQSVRLTPADWVWAPSPEHEVERVMLDRVGDEVAVATSFVRYAPGSDFPAHEHALGEEFIVLEGEFSDEHGRYPAGSYIRNPAGSKHTPFSDTGCIIWVKLRQFDRRDQRQCVLSLDLPIPEQSYKAKVLHRHEAEVVHEICAAAGSCVRLEPTADAQEILVLEGEVALEDARYPSGSWLRIPGGDSITLGIIEPTRLFTKTRPVFS